MSENNEIDLSEHSEDSGEDFSASEDDWVPDKRTRHDTSSSDDSDDFEDTPAGKAIARKKQNTKNTLPAAKKNAKNDESDSSGDDHLVDPRTLDLKSKFFNVAGPSTASKSNVPNFDCNVGLNLTDSDDDDDEFEAVDEPATKPTAVNLSRNVNFNKDLEKAKKYLENFRSNSIGKDDQNLDVTNLLAIGESSKTMAPSTIPPKKRKADSDSEWEDVTDATENASNMIISVGPTIAPKVDRTQENIEASIKRKLNRQKKDAQVIMHKVHVLCWIGHGNYINKILNDSRLMKMCLSFMPSKRCYPKDRTDKVYFEQISEWYKNSMALKNDKENVKLTKLPPLAVSLALQIQNKSAICKKDYVLIFIVLLRAIGIQCRLVVNLVPVPIRPAQSELCSLSSKSVDKSNERNSSVAKKQVASATKKLTRKSKDRKESNSTSKNTQKLSSLTRKNSPSAIDQRQSTSHKDSKSSKYPKSSTTTLPSTSNSLRAKLNATTAKIENAEQIRNSKTAQPVVPFNKSKSKQLEIVPENSAKESVNVFSSPISRRTRGKVNEGKKTVYKPPMQQLDGGDDRRATKRKAPNLSKLKIAKTPPSTGDKRSRSSGADTDSDFMPSPPKVVRPAQPKVVQNVKKGARLDRRILSTDDDNDETVAEQSKRNGMNFWVEVFTEVEDKWIAIDLFKPKVDSVDAIRNAVTKPICYVLAWNNNNTIKDVSSRYCTNWNTVTRKQRVDPEWLKNTLHAYLENPTLRSRMEDMELNKIHLKEPLPTAISDFKDHPLYALERHLLKFQAIYPPDALTLGFIRKEAVYARECVHTLHSRELWVKQARTVMPAQTPYKIVKARPKWDRQTNKMLEPLPLEIFGIWQTKPYEPPTAENGIVPRNAYGNVELFKPEMLPKKTVHLQLPSLNRTCKKMGVDCANAVIGFDYHSGSCHPTFDGFIVCEEFAEQVVAQWWLDQEEAQRKEEEKINQRVYGNWKKLVRGLMIRQHLQRKYNFAETGPDVKKMKKEGAIEEIKKISDSKKKAANEASETGGGCSTANKQNRKRI